MECRWRPPTGWIDPTTPIPTTSTDPGVPGLYEGAKYCSTGLYRPTYASKMRVLGPQYEQINEEQLIKRIYNWVSPLDSSSPLSSDVTLALGDSQAFQVAVPTPDTHSLAVTWYVDNLEAVTGLTFTFNSTTFGTGLHTVQVIVEDPTPKVRNDPGNVLRDNRTWIVTVKLQTVVIDGCNTGVGNRVLDDGSTISDRIAECGAGAHNHGEFVSCVAHLTNDLKHAGIITDREKGAIQSCAAKADIP